MLKTLDKILSRQMWVKFGKILNRPIENLEYNFYIELFLKIPEKF